MSEKVEAIRKAAYKRRETALEMRRFGLTYKSIGAWLGVSAVRASQIVAKAERQERGEA